MFRSPHFRLLAFMIVGSGLLLRSCAPTQSLCVMGFCFKESLNTVARSFSEDGKTFEVAGPLEHEGRTRHTEHFFELGADESISRQLRAHQFKIKYGGTPFAYEGYALRYRESTMDGQEYREYPAQFESAASNKGYAEIPYDWLVVTEIKSPGPKTISQR